MKCGITSKSMLKEVIKEEWGKLHLIRLQSWLILCKIDCGKSLNIDDSKLVFIFSKPVCVFTLCAAHGEQEAANAITHIS